MNSRQASKKSAERLEAPVASRFESPLEFLRARIEYRRATEKGFSVTKQCFKLKRCSKALVSMILAGKRAITPERVDDLSILMGLSAKERHAFRCWIVSLNTDLEQSEGFELGEIRGYRKGRRKDVSEDLLSDWLHVYVKDAFRFPHIQNSPQEVLRFFRLIAPPERVEKSLNFLLREGYLRRTLDGRVVEDAPLMVAEHPDKSAKIRSFHKKSLLIARQAIDLVSTEKRIANAIVLPLSDQKYLELLELVEEFSEKLKAFAEQETLGKETSGSLYQLVVNLCPVGGTIRDI